MAKKWIAYPYIIWMAIFVIIPYFLIIYYSVTSETGENVIFTLENFTRFFEPIYLKVMGRSLYLAFISTCICLLLGYPVAYIMAQKEFRAKSALVFLFIMPMWMNFLLRTYSWLSILETNGLLNTVLSAINLPKINILYTEKAVILGMVYNFLPFMILPIYSCLKKMDIKLIEAAKDLGADDKTVFSKVVFPLSIPGVVSGITMVFMPAVTAFVIPNILGGGQILIGNLIEQQFLSVGNWSFGSAVSVIMMILIVISMAIMSAADKEAGGDKA